MPTWILITPVALSGSGQEVTDNTVLRHSESISLVEFIFGERMVPSINAINLIKRFEGCRLVAYPDPASELAKAVSMAKLKASDYQQLPGWEAFKGDPWTVGWGHTGYSVKEGQKITHATADSLLNMDAAHAAWILHDLKLNQNQFDALTSFVFNVGSHAFRHSTMCRYLEIGNYKAASKEFLKWTHANGAVMDGLTRRREAERALFDTPMPVEGDNT